MKKIIYFAILLVGCSKTPTTTTGTTPTNGSFSINGTTYLMERSYITNISNLYTQINIENGTASNLAEIFANYKSKDTVGYLASIMQSGGGSTTRIYYDYYLRGSKAIFSNTTKITTTKNANGTYTISGAIDLYENFDSTKKVTITANVTTL